MNEIRNAISIPLVMHGGTGVSDEDIKKCISNGIAKLNINTELQVEWTKAVREYLDNDKQVYDPRKIISSGEKAIKEVIRNKTNLLNSNNRI
jgi:fructose/tagatose bisphosphate aldolase